jgi:hypothetical protein
MLWRTTTEGLSWREQINADLVQWSIRSETGRSDIRPFIACAKWTKLRPRLNHASLVLAGRGDFTRALGVSPASNCAGGYCAVAGLIRAFCRVLQPQSSGMMPLKALSPSIDFPVEPVMRSTLLRRFRAGTTRASPVARHVLQPSRLPDQAARQPPDLSTIIRVEPSSTDDSRLRGALPGADFHPESHVTQSASGTGRLSGQTIIPA